MPADEVYEQLFAINQRAFAEGDYATACHALEAALDRAHFCQDVQHLDAISATAQEQEAQLATLPLPERVSGVSDQRRRTLRRLLESIAAEVPTMKSLIQHELDLAQRRFVSDARESGMQSMSG